MSKINKVLSNIDQSDPSTGGFTEEEKARIRNNIGAMSSVDSSVMREIGKSVPTGDAGKISDDDYVATNLTSDSKGIIFKTVLNLLDWIKGKLGISSSGDETLFMNQKGAWVTPPDTTYESKEELENSNEVSLVTRGEKFTWNHKQDDVGIDPANGDPDKYLNQQGDWTTPPKYFDRDAAEGGTDESLVLTGDKFRWNQIDGVMELIPADASSSNKLVTMAQLADFGGFAIVPLTSTTPKVPDPSAATPPVKLSTKIIYLTKVVSDPNDPAKDKYEEWIYTGDPSQPVVISSWECIGEATVDLSNYYTKGEVDTLLADKISRNEVSVVVLTDPTKQTINLKTGLSINVVVEHQDLSGKQDLISDLQTIREGAAAGATAVQPDDLATVATTGSYNDLEDKPTIPDPQIQSDWNQTDTTAIDFIKNKPDVNDIFIVSYGTGSISDISAAVNAGKTVIARKLGGVHDYYAILTQRDYGNFYFTRIDGNSVETWSISQNGGAGTWGTTTTSIPDAQVNADWNAASGSVAEILNKPSLATVATSGNYSDLNGTPNLATVATSGNYGDLSNTPNLAAVATSGNYSDLNGTPNLATVATSGNYSDLNGTPNLATVATTGDYEDLDNLPDIPAGVKVLEYMVSTWQDFLDAYNNGYHLYVIWKDTSAQPNPTLRRIGQLSYVNVVNNAPDRAEFSYVRAKTSEVGSLIVYTLYSDSTWGTTSTKFVNMQDGTNTTVTRTNYNFKVNVADEKVLPSHTSTDSGKSLVVDSSGNAIWDNPTLNYEITGQYASTTKNIHLTGYRGSRVNGTTDRSVYGNANGIQADAGFGSNVYMVWPLNDTEEGDGKGIRVFGHDDGNYGWYAGSVIVDKGDPITNYHEIAAILGSSLRPVLREEVNNSTSAPLYLYYELAASSKCQYIFTRKVDNMRNPKVAGVVNYRNCTMQYTLTWGLEGHYGEETTNPDWGRWEQYNVSTARPIMLQLISVNGSWTIVNENSNDVDLEELYIMMTTGEDVIIYTRISIGPGTFGNIIFRRSLDTTGSITWEGSQVWTYHPGSSDNSYYLYRLTLTGSTTGYTLNLVRDTISCNGTSTTINP